jgi:1,4-alpha-glucan branching enzyme
MKERDKSMNQITQEHITEQTPIGTNLVEDSKKAYLGATVRVWGPNASAVYLNGNFNGATSFTEDVDKKLLLQKRGEYWTGFLAGAKPGDTYKFYVVGDDGGGFKRDPYARELTLNPAFPKSDCILRDPDTFNWHDRGFRPPPFNEMIVYQLHIGAFSRRPDNRMSTYLDVVEKVEYLAELGVRNSAAAGN